jgi:hypothetical protein
MHTMDKIGSMAFPAGSKDPLYTTPYIDVDEWRDQPVRHRYVHGGFEGTGCKFSYYFPPVEIYEGRFYQHLMAVSGMEKAAFEPAMEGFMIADSVQFTIDAGAYFVESNQGRTTMFPGDDPTINYRASAASARYSRVVAADMYGPHRPYGYVFGGSGGAYKALACFENAIGVWDGALPYVMGSPVSILNLFTVQAHAMRVLRDKFLSIVDALEPGAVGDLLMVGFGEAHFKALTSIQAGDEVMIDNSVYLATQTYHRHQVPPSDEYYVWDQYKAAGRPIYPQRPEILGLRYAPSGGGVVQSGRFGGKMIVVESMMDEAAYPWQADWYRSRVMEAQGLRFEDNFRLYFVDHAMHTSQSAQPNDPRPVVTTRTVNYTSVLHQALRDLSDWVEKGLVPPPSTVYKIEDGQVVVPLTAAERKGVQPVVTLTANGGVWAEVAVGETVEFVGVIEVPPGTGTIVGAEWDFEGAGDFPVAEKFDFSNNSFSRMTVKTIYAYSQPGTYFPVLRGSSHRHGDIKTKFARIANIDRVRVVVK